MIRQSLLVSVLSLAFLTGAFGEIRFSIRYHEKRIYHPGDPVTLKLSISNDSMTGDGEALYLDDMPVRSFGFDVRDLTGNAVMVSSSYAAGLNGNNSRYRVVNLAPGQELSLTVDLRNWVEIQDPGQYRITGWYYPALRGGGSLDARPLAARETLALSVLPAVMENWREELDEDVKRALTARDMDPAGTVAYILNARKSGKINRALLYMDLEGLYRSHPVRLIRWNMADEEARMRELELFRKSLLNDMWEIPGLDQVMEDAMLISSTSYPDEAVVRMQVSYRPRGILFEKNLWFFLHKTQGYWAVRRVEEAPREPAGPEGFDPESYGRSDLDPRGVVAEVLKAALRDDWEIILRYLDVENMVKNLPEYKDQWMVMSAADHETAQRRYRQDLLANRISEDSGRLPLQEIGNWTFFKVEYTNRSGIVEVHNEKSFPVGNGDKMMMTRYLFHLENRSEIEGEDFWKIVDYNIVGER